MRAAGDAELLEEEQRPPFAFEQAMRHDAYWCTAWRGEAYARPDFDYEDYAPAYCVGYVGQAQYGGAWSDAVPSLRANWERIKGGSRLSTDDALLAAHAAWQRADRLSQATVPVPQPALDEAVPQPVFVGQSRQLLGCDCHLHESS